MSATQKRIIIGVALAGAVIHFLFVLLHSSFAYALTWQVWDRVRYNPEYHLPDKSLETNMNDSLLVRGIPVCIYLPAILATGATILQLARKERKVVVLSVFGISVGILTVAYAIVWFLVFL
jgi:hypothetical protein